MNTHFPHHRFDHSFSEGRLIFVDVPQGKIEKGTQVATEFVIGSVQFGKEIGQDFFRGISNAWDRAVNDPTDAKDTQLRAIANFSRTMPLDIQNTIAKNFDREKPTLMELAELMNHENWINLFSNPDSYLNLAEHPVAPLTLRSGPEGILYSLDQNGRRNLYRQYVTKVIALEVTDNAGFKDIFGDRALQSPSERAEMMVANNATINQAMRLSLGIGNGAAIVKAADPTAFNIAKTNLMQHYWRDFERPRDANGNLLSVARPPDFATTTDPRGVTPEFGDDLSRATGDKMLLGSMEDVRKGLDDKVPSYLKGALDPDMEIFQESDIPDIQQMMLQRATEKNIRSHEKSAKLDRYLKTTTNEKNRNAETIGETFMNLSGVEKAMLVFLAYKAFKNMPGMMSGLTAVYFGQKFLLKQEDPINKMWVPLVRGLTDKVSNNAVVAGAFKKLNIDMNKQYTSADIQFRKKVAEDFLSERLHARLDESVEGFTILGDMPIAELSKYLKITSNGSHAVLDHTNKDFQGIVREKLSRHGQAGSAAKRFFDDASALSFDVDSQNPNASKELGISKVNEHMLDSGNALASVYYLIASRSPDFRDAMTIVEHFRGMVRYGSYNDLPYGEYSYDYNEDGRPDLVNPRELYVAMVKAGAKMAGGMQGITLFDFMEQEMRSKELPYKSKTTIAVAQGPGVAPAGVAGSPGLTPTPPLTPSPAPSLTPSPAPTPSTSPSLTPGTPVTPSTSPSLTPGTPVTPSTSPSLTPGTPVTPSTSPSLTPSPTGAPSGSPSLTPAPAAGPGSSPSLTPTPATAPAGSPSLTPGPVSTPGGAPSLSPGTAVSPATSPELGASPAATPGIAPDIIPNAAGNPNTTTNISPGSSSGPTSAPNVGANTGNTPKPAPKKIPNGGTGPSTAPSAQAQ